MQVINIISTFAIPVMIFLILFYGLSEKKVNVYHCFVEGAKDGIDATIRVLPPLVALLMAVAIFRESGALELITYGLKPLISIIGMPLEVLPLAIIRPISGSAALASVIDTINNCGPDSFPGRVASIMMGSTETTLYNCNIFRINRNKRFKAYCKSALLTGILLSVWICRLMFK